MTRRRTCREARAGVFGCMAMMLAERITDAADRRSCAALLQRMDEIVELGDVHVYYPVNLEFHQQIGADGRQQAARD